MIKINITSDKENADMFSTDDSDDGEFHEDEESSNDDLSEDASENGDNKEPLMNKKKKKKPIIAPLPGPFYVEFGKAYKPVFICFLDLMFAVTFMIFALLYYWSHLLPTEQMQWDHILSFMPFRIILFSLILDAKFFLDIFFLRVGFTKNELNTWGVTSSLFWFRILFDVIVFGAIMFVYHFEDDTTNLGSMWNFIALFVPKFFIEVIIYHLSVKQSYRRSVYQEFNRAENYWKKNGVNPLEKVKKDNDYFEKLQNFHEMEQNQKSKEKMNVTEVAARDQKKKTQLF